jgi:Fur family ferric uptake transcriptional regulator
VTGAPSARRLTKQQTAVADALGDIGDFTSAQDLHAKLRTTGHPVGLATVYRALQTLSEEGDVDVLRTDDGESVYRRCSTGAHHHHLVCRSCGRTVEVEGPTVERWADTVSAQHGFRDVTHTVEIFGTCADCAD